MLRYTLRFRIGIWVLRWLGLGGSRAPRLLRTLLEDLLQGEEDVEYSRIVFLILLPSPSTLDVVGWLNPSMWWSWPKIKMNHQFWILSQNVSWSFLSIYLPGAKTSTWTLGSYNLVILLGFVIIKSRGLLLLTNPNPRGRFQLGWTVQ